VGERVEHDDEVQHLAFTGAMLVMSVPQPVQLRCGRSPD
jgi:hypothetical protein